MTTNLSRVLPIVFLKRSSLKNAQAQRHAGRFARVSIDGDSPNGSGFIALLEAFRPTGGTAPGEIVARRSG